MKTMIILDYDNFNKVKEEMDIEISEIEFLNFLKTFNKESEIQTAYAYVGINEKLPHEKDREIDELTKSGYIVRTIMGDNYGMNYISDCSQEMTMDILRSVYENKTSVVMLVSNSKKLEKLVEFLRERDIIVETVFFDGSSNNYDLAIKSTGFINLNEYIKDEDESEDVFEEDSELFDIDEDELDEEKIYKEELNNILEYINEDPKKFLYEWNDYKIIKGIAQKSMEHKFNIVNKLDNMFNELEKNGDLKNIKSIDNEEVENNILFEEDENINDEEDSEEER